MSYTLSTSFRQFTQKQSFSAKPALKKLAKMLGEIYLLFSTSI